MIFTKQLLFYWKFNGRALNYISFYDSFDLHNNKTVSSCQISSLELLLMSLKLEINLKTATHGHISGDIVQCDVCLLEFCVVFLVLGK